MSVSRRVYQQCGLRMRTELTLPLPVAQGDGWDVDVRLGDEQQAAGPVPPGTVIAVYESDGERWYTATEADDGYRLRFVGCGEFVISHDLTGVSVRPERGGRTELLPILLAGTVTAFLLNLRGSCVLHASAVALDDGRALAVVGQSGRGKSTVAALLCVDGASLVTDDVLAVVPGPPIGCLGGASELRLRAAASEIPGLLSDRAATRATADERLAFAPPTAGTDEPVPLGAIVIPAPSTTATEVDARRLRASDAVFALLSFPRVHGWRRRDVLARDFAVLSTIANTVPVYEVTLPWGPPFSPGLAPALRALVAEGAAVGQ